MNHVKYNNSGACRKISLTAFFFVLMFLYNATTLQAQTGSVNFSGTWTFNESKSTQSEFRFAPSLMTVTQEGNNMSIESTRRGMDNEEVKGTAKYTLDGKECSNPGFQNNPRKSVLTWSADGKTLTFTHSNKFGDGDQEFKYTETWKINPDKTLAVETTMNFQGQENKTTNVYDKK